MTTVVLGEPKGRRKLTEARRSKKGDLRRLPEGHPDRYDWSKATRGKYLTKAAKASALLRMLDPALARHFPDSRSVNAALRGLLTLEDVFRPRRRRGRRAA